MLVIWVYYPISLCFLSVCTDSLYFENIERSYHFLPHGGGWWKVGGNSTKNDMKRGE